MLRRSHDDSTRRTIDPAAVARDALERRAGLPANLDAWRCLHGAADGAPGLYVDLLGQCLIAQVHEQYFPAGADAARPIVEALAARLSATSAYLKLFPRDRSASLERLDALHRDAAPWFGRPAPAEFEIIENGLRFAIRPYDGYSFGLFLEQRDNRAWLRSVAADCRVLNLFAYTCAFGVSAAAGGAIETVNVDASKRWLERGRSAYVRNGLSVDRGTAWFIASDVREYFARARRQERVFDVIVLDPPTFGRARGSPPFSFPEQLDGLAREAIQFLAPGGRLLLSTNHRQTSMRRLEQAIRAAAGDRRISAMQRPAPPADFSGDPDYSKTIRIKLD